MIRHESSFSTRIVTGKQTGFSLAQRSFSYGENHEFQGQNRKPHMLVLQPAAVLCEQ